MTDVHTEKMPHKILPCDDMVTAETNQGDFITNLNWLAKLCPKKDFTIMLFILSELH